MKLDKAIEDVLAAEADLAKQWRVIGERHAAEHDVYHLGHTLARECAQHVERMAPYADRYGAKRRDVMAQSPRTGGTGAAQERGAPWPVRGVRAVAAGGPQRSLPVRAEAELSWVILIQAAQAVRDPELFETATACHEQTENCAKWLRTRITEANPQVLATG